MMDGLGLHMFDGANFENTLEQLISHWPESVPIPPTPQPPSPSLVVSGMGHANGMKPVLPPYSPAPPVGLPYLYPFGHIHRGQSYGGSYDGTVDLLQMDPNVVHERLALQMQIYAFNNGAMVSDSPLSPSSMPFPVEETTVRIDVSIPRTCVVEQRFVQEHPATRHKSRIVIETVNESKAGEHLSEPQHYYAPRPAHWDESADEVHVDDGEWIDQGIGGMEGVANDLLQLEFHRDYVGNPEKSRGKLHPVAMHTAGRDSSLYESTDMMMGIRSAFAELAAHHRRASCLSSLLEQLSRVSSSSRDGSSSSSSDTREDDLRRTLDTAIGSLHALGSLYEQQEMWWTEEKHRLDEDTKEKVQLLLKQVLGVGVIGNLVATAL
ncbi:hypothetical protein V8E53_001276 [Lactarius tabidus]